MLQTTNLLIYVESSSSKQNIPTGIYYSNFYITVNKAVISTESGPTTRKPGWSVKTTELFYFTNSVVYMSHFYSQPILKEKNRG